MNSSLIWNSRGDVSNTNTRKRARTYALASDNANSSRLLRMHTKYFFRSASRGGYSSQPREISRTDNRKRVTMSYVVARWKAAADVKRAVPLSRATPLLTFNDVYRHGCPGDKRFWYLHPLDTRAALPFRCFYWRYAGERYQETFVRIAADGSRFDENICSSCPTVLLPFGYVSYAKRERKKKKKKRSELRICR